MGFGELEQVVAARETIVGGLIKSFSRKIKSGNPFSLFFVEKKPPKLADDLECDDAGGRFVTLVPF